MLKILAFFLSILCTSFILKAQGKDSVITNHTSVSIQNLVGRTGIDGDPVVKKYYVLVVNGFAITDSIRIKFFFENYKKEIRKMSFFSEKKAREKLKIELGKEVLVCKMKKGFFIDIVSLKQIKQ